MSGYQRLRSVVSEMQSSHLTISQHSFTEESPGIGRGGRLSRPSSHGGYSRGFPLSNVKVPARESTRREAKSQNSCTAGAATSPKSRAGVLAFLSPHCSISFIDRNPPILNERNRLITTVASPHKFRGYDGGEQRGATCQNRYRLRGRQYCRSTFAHQGLTGTQPLH
jgi:hypothetical protein